MKYIISLLVASTLILNGISSSAQNYTVNNAGNQGDVNPGDGICLTALGFCTLRAAIDEANATAGPNIIDFSLATGTLIGIDSELELSDDGTTINADFGLDGIPDIIIDAGSVNMNGFHIQSSNNVIQGFNLINFQGPGTNAPILIDGFGGPGANNNTIISNYIGTNLVGGAVSPTPNFRSLRIVNGATGNLIGNGTIAGRNIISGNTFGIEINTSDNNTVAGNIIGLDAAGSLDLGNNDRGIEVLTSNGTIIGSAGEGINYQDQNPKIHQDQWQQVIVGTVFTLASSVCRNNAIPLVA